MKFKLTATDDMPYSLIVESNRPSFAAHLKKEVIEGCLHVKPDDIGPATHYLQHTDLLVPTEDSPRKLYGAVVGFTMLSVTPHRAQTWFHDAMWKTQAIYRQLLRSHMPLGSDTELFVALALDDRIHPPAHMGTEKKNLIETVPIIVVGECTKSSGYSARQMITATDAMAHAWLETSHEISPWW